MIRPSFLANKCALDEAMPFERRCYVTTCACQTHGLTNMIKIPTKNKTLRGYHAMASVPVRPAKQGHVPKRELENANKGKQA